MEKLGSKKLAVAATTTGALSIPAKRMLFIIARVTSISVSSTPFLRLNGDAVATNYFTDIWTRTNVATPVHARTATTATAGVVIGLPSLLGRISFVTVHNILEGSARRLFDIATVLESSTQTAPTKEEGEAYWLSSAQITSIEMIAGSGNLGVGSGFTVYGKDT